MGPFRQRGLADIDGYIEPKIGSAVEKKTGLEAGAAAEFDQRAPRGKPSVISATADLSNATSVRAT
jgi:hypothetical protein